MGYVDAQPSRYGKAAAIIRCGHDVILALHAKYEQDRGAKMRRSAVCCTVVELVRPEMTSTRYAERYIWSRDVWQEPENPQLGQEAQPGHMKWG
jgi:hypothetical protein